MARDEEDPTQAALRDAHAHLALLLLALPPYTIHFKSPAYLQPATLDLLDTKAAKHILRTSAENAKVREAVGRDERYWREMVELVQAGVRGFEERSFHMHPRGGDGDGRGEGEVDYEATSGALIASHYPGLWRDIERLNSLLSISRNVLTSGAGAQDLAGAHAVEQQIFRLVHVCVRVTARGYDGDAGTGEEEKWQSIVNAYKKLLITSLQWLNNFVAGNEVRKLMLWVSLFDNDHPSSSSSSSSGDADADTSSPSSPQPQHRHHQSDEVETAKPTLPAKKPTPPLTTNDILLAYGTNGSSRISPLEMEGAVPIYAHSHGDNTVSNITSTSRTPTGFVPLPPQIATLVKKNRFEPNGYVYFTNQKRPLAVQIYQRDHGRSPTLAEIHRAIPVLWEQERSLNGKNVSEKKVWELWQGMYDRAVTKYHEEVGRWEKGLPALVEEEQQGGRDRTEKEKEKEERKVGGGRKEEKKVAERKEGKVDMAEKIRALEEEVRSRLQGEFSARPRPSDPAAPTGAGFTEKEGAPSPLSILDPKMGRSLVGGKNGEEYTHMHFSAAAGAKILESGKVELMKRLEGYAAEDELAAATAAGDSKGEGEGIVAVRSRSGRRSSGRNGNRRRRRRRESLSSAFAPGGSLGSDDEGDGEEDDVDESDEDDEEDEEEDYPGSSEDGRGLLTDVPLILGPSEIEVLPMLVMSGIVSSSAPSKNDGKVVEQTDPTDTSSSSSSTLTTHLLLTRTSGRNLLRELLIFVAAWDLREEELYFKFMVKITERILECGLMPYAYHSFRDRSRSKDIVSPSQAVIMKLLTTIFRNRNEALRDQKMAEYRAATHYGTDAAELNNEVAPPTDVELHILNFIFTEFRQHIIPQTCALIFLQGQIHLGRASPEDFPLNLWDMERMYEGVYQFLEFFAVLAEEYREQVRGQKPEFVAERMERGVLEEGVVSWKGILAEWEMACELVTLLRELEGGIPKAAGAGQNNNMVGQGQIRGENKQGVPAAPQRSLSADAATTGPSAVAVERPFELDDAALPPLPTTANQIFEAETPLAYPEENIGTDVPESGPEMGMGMDMHDQDEPSDFEWRNLKKLTVLVLSSLIWKNKQVQDQVRKCGGLEALVGCCKPDEHNPYIREHAIMCLRFAVEGCEENAEVIKKMAREHGSGGGVLDDRVRAANTVSSSVPKEVLDTHGYETFMDSKGQVGLRRKVDKNTALAQAGYLESSLISAADRSATASAPPGPTGPAGTLPEPPGAGSASSNKGKLMATTTKMTAEKAAELMQNALRDLPLGDKLVTDRQKAEALARLDRAFQSTEKALGRSESGSSGGGKNG